MGCEDLHHLRELVVSDRGLVVEDLRALAGLRQLDGLFLDDEELGVRHLERAGFAQRLRRLRVGRFDDRDAAALPAFPALTSLALDCQNLSAKAASSLAGSTNLSELEVELRGDEAETDLDAVLGRLQTSRLARLAVAGSCVRLGDRGLAAALSIEGLRVLRLGTHQHGERAVAPSFRGLTSLDLSCSGGVCWRSLGDATTLRELDLIGPTQDLWNALPELPELTRLRLGHLGTRVGGDVNLARLESLQLLGSMLPARVQAPLRALSLTRLTQARSAELFDVAQGSVDRLEHLKVDTELSEGDLAKLQRLQSLRTLELAPFPDGAEVVDQVLRLVRALPRLRRLAVGRKDDEQPKFHMSELPGLRSRLAEEAPWIAQVSSIDD